MKMAMHFDADNFLYSIKTENDSCTAYGSAAYTNESATVEVRQKRREWSCKKIDINEKKAAYFATYTSIFN